MEKSVGERILADTASRYEKGAHPRLIVTEERAEMIRKAEKTSHFVQVEMEALRKRCDSYMTRKPSFFEIRDGIRLLYVSREVEDVVVPCALCYRLTGEEKYAERAYLEMKAAAEFPNWNPRHFLDVAELALSLGLGYDWLYNWMSEEQRAVIRSALCRHAFGPVMDDYENRTRERTYRWYQDKPGDNWKLVCDGGISVAMLAVYDEILPEELPDSIRGCENLPETILTYAYHDAYSFIREAYVPLDGSYTESMTYWNYATDFLSYYHTSLITAAGKDYGLTDHEGLRKTSSYMKGLMSNACSTFNYGDAHEVKIIVPVFLWVGKYFGDDSFSQMRINRALTGSPEFRDLYWFEGDPTEKPLGAVALSYGAVGSENASFRDSWSTDDGIFAAVHYGDNGVCHAHCDTGTFVLEYAGKRFFADLGPDNYNLVPYRGTYRYRAEGHNTIVVNPSADAGQKPVSSCRIARFEEGERSFSVADMTVAYENASIVRGLMLDRKNHTVTLQDEITVKNTDRVMWFGHTKAQIDISPDRKSAVLTLDGTKLYAALAADGEFTVMDTLPMPASPNVDGQAVNEGFKKLTVDLVGKEKYTLAVLFSKTPIADAKTEPIAAW